MTANPFDALANVIATTRDHHSLVLRIADRRAAERAAAERRLAQRGHCATGCTAPVAVVEPEPLCEQCAREMRA